MDSAPTQLQPMPTWLRRGRCFTLSSLLYTHSWQLGGLSHCAALSFRQLSLSQLVDHPPRATRSPFLTFSTYNRQRWHFGASLSLPYLLVSRAVQMRGEPASSRGRLCASTSESQALKTALTDNNIYRRLRRKETESLPDLFLRRFGLRFVRRLTQNSAWDSPERKRLPTRFQSVLPADCGLRRDTANRSITKAGPCPLPEQLSGDGDGVVALNHQKFPTHLP